jgi:hypothetical protein
MRHCSGVVCTLVGDLIESLCKILYREGFSETSASFVALPIALMSGVLVIVGFISRCIGRQLVCRYVFEVAIEDLAIKGTEARVSTCHLGWSMLVYWSLRCSLEGKRVEVGDVA